MSNFLLLFFEKKKNKWIVRHLFLLKVFDRRRTKVLKNSWLRFHYLPMKQLNLRRKQKRRLIFGRRAFGRTRRGNFDTNWSPISICRRPFCLTGLLRRSSWANQDLAHVEIVGVGFEETPSLYRHRRTHPTHKIPPSVSRSLLKLTVARPSFATQHNNKQQKKNNEYNNNNKKTNATTTKETPTKFLDYFRNG